MLRLIILLALAAPAHADQWVSPSTAKLTSPNKKWAALIVPASNGTSGARATITAPGGAAVTFALDSKWMPVDSVLLDDGTLLTLDHWHRLGHGKVAQLYERDGKVRWEKTLIELIGQPVIDTIDHSVSSIWWRKTPLEWSLSKDGKRVLITMFDENKLELTIKDGSSTIAIVTNLPDDPDRQYARAKALAKQDGQASGALQILEKMLAKDPEHYEAILLYLEVAQKVNDHPLAVAMLDRVSPKWKLASPGYRQANVAVAWATSLVAVSRLADAERVLRQGAVAAPQYPNPVLALAKLLFDSKRDADAVRELDDLVARSLKISSADYYTVSAVGDFYRQRKDLPRALATYLKGYKKSEITNQFMYASLAQVYEELGKIADAIRIHEQLLAYFKQLGAGFDGYIKSTQDQIRRLRALRP